jgi:3-oxoacyl-[acyl-carrier protein] reductase
VAVSGRLNGQVAIVTGGGRGIGRAVAVALAEAGMSVAVVARTAAQVRETVQRIDSDRARALGFAVDVTDAGALARLLPQVEQRLGPIDLLVNGAGRSESTEAPLWDSDVEECWSVIETNLRGPLIYAAAVLPDMVRRRRGRIVNVGSLLGATPSATSVGYALSKGALCRLTDCLAAALAGTGVSVFEISPGLVRTAMTRDMARWAEVPEAEWVPAERTAELVLAVASGGLDPLSGRFLHATDDLATLQDRVAQITSNDARVLRLVPYGDDDPLFAPPS